MPEEAMMYLAEGLPQEGIPEMVVNVKLFPFRFNRPAVMFNVPVTIKFCPSVTSPPELLIITLLTVAGFEGKVPVAPP